MQDAAVPTGDYKRSSEDNTSEIHADSIMDEVMSDFDEI